MRTNKCQQHTQDMRTNKCRQHTTLRTNKCRQQTSVDNTQYRKLKIEQQEQNGNIYYMYIEESLMMNMLIFANKNVDIKFSANDALLG